MRIRTVLYWCLVAALAACSPAGPASSGQGGLPTVLATETFLADFAQNVAGNRIVVGALISPGLDPHEFQPTPQDAIRIEQAQVLIINGLGYESWLTKTAAEMAQQKAVIVATDGLKSRSDPSGEHPDGDPHMWMSPRNVIHYVENIRDGLSRADPAGSALYRSNADTYIAKLQELDKRMQAQIGQIPLEKRLLVTNHDALSYFAQDYGFTVVGAVIPGLSPDAAPSAKEMSGLIQSIKSSGAPAIFLDISENQKLANQIASESGAKVITDLYVETLSPAGGPASTYIDMMLYDVATIVTALK